MSGFAKFRIGLGFGVGSIGISILQNTIGTFFPAMMVTVLGQPAGLAGAILATSKLYDAGADVAIGAVSDRTRGSIGRRPYLLLGALVGAGSLLAIFLPPQLGDTMLAAYMFAALIVYSTGYSLFSVPYMALGAEMASGYRDRTSLFSYRMFFISAGQVLSQAIAAKLIIMGGEGAHGYAVMGGIMAAITAATMLISYFATREPPPSTPKHAKVPLKVAVRSLLENRPLTVLILAKFFHYVSIGVAGGMRLLFMLNVLKLGYGGQVQLALVQNIASAAAVPLWVWIAGRIGKKPAIISGIVLLAAVNFSWLLVGPEPALSEIWIRGIGLGVFSAGMILVGTSMLADTMEYDVLTNGLHRAGIFSSIYAIVEKAGFALGPAIVGFCLATAGYIPSSGGNLVPQPASAVTALYLGTAVIPGALLLLSLVPLALYRLNEAQLKTLKAAT